ncbi:class I SAM-dependent methyltransferase [Candidatus Nitrotoga sp. 1052]|uniref:class I SAM-dependent methyltransferase n=1 Tax=Candidatus Nitrotoga sp. 1052 TaxID=2886964 RepID=UPI001EF648CF|nr:methyltransferase domain-containing protein [Candidatus Nitrotoga sp. 1052]CAH1078565.1 Methyltransferase domain-containing protein [Candidatus Nitrotoga sp. 1052]
MSQSPSFTGERFLPECSGEIWYEHWHRYALARQLSQHCTVLDVACGEGYGAAMVAETAYKVVGVDLSVDVIQHAKNNYRHHANLQFVTATCECLPFSDASFDCAISFETIEHIEKQKEFISELTRVLRPNGILILSSPNKHLYSDAHDYHNEFHVRELYRNELEELLHVTFPHIFWLGQKLLFHSAIWPENQACATTEYLVSDDRQVTVVNHPSVEPMYYIAVCSRNPSMLPTALNKLSLFSDSAEMVYQDYAKQTRRVMELDQLLKDREYLIAERDNLLSLRTQQMEESEHLIAERDNFLLLRTQQMEEREHLIAERDALLDMRTEQLNEYIEQLNGRTEQLNERTEEIVKLNALLTLRNEQIAEHERLNVALNQQIDYRASLVWWLKSPLRFITRAIRGNS